MAAKKKRAAKKSKRPSRSRAVTKKPAKPKVSARKAGGDLLIEISIKDQTLRLLSAARELMRCSVSTARNGAGELMNSGCTPRGRHIIAEKIGDGEPVNTVFVGRRPTGEIYSRELRERHPGRDWILTRILWLRGLEPGVNRGGNVDTYNRYIYIHGSPDDVPMGKPGSAGCIRMRNSELNRLFRDVNVGTPVIISG